MAFRASSRLERVIQIRDDMAGCLTFSPDGDELALCSFTYIELIDVKTGNTRITLEGYRNSAREVVYCQFPSRLCIAAASVDSSVKLWDVKTGICLCTLYGHTDWLTCLCFSYRADHLDKKGPLLVSGSFDRTLRFWIIDETGQSGTAGLTLAHNSAVMQCAFSQPSGRILASIDINGTLHSWKLPLCEPGVKVSLHTHILVSSFPPKGYTTNKFVVAYTFRDGGGVFIRDPTSTHDFGIRCTLEDGTNAVNCLCFSSDGSHLVSGTTSSEVIAWNIETTNDSGLPAKRFKGHKVPLRKVCIDPTGKQRIASLSEDGTICIWTLRPWHDRDHGLFSQEFRSLVFCLMCIKQRYETPTTNHSVILPRLFMATWLHIFMYVQVLTD